MNFKTYAELNEIIFDNLEKLPKNIDLIVGIPRSGMLVANIIALYLNLPLVDIESFRRGYIYKGGDTRKKEWINEVGEARKILLVDDSCDSGKAINKAKEMLIGEKYFDKIITCVVFVTSKSKKIPDVFFEVCEGPRMFEWNYMHHSHLQRTCFDLDGVLCRDPMEEENDDGEKYIEFIKNVPAKFVPTFKIAYIITARLEKYRKETEQWLEKNNILYNELIMMPFETKEERVKSGSHGSFKAENYKKFKDTFLFVESNEQQALEISNLSKKAVFCIENHKFYEAGKGAVRQLYVRNVKKRLVDYIYVWTCKVMPKWMMNYLKEQYNKLRG